MHRKGRQLLERHVSLEHTLLNLQAADILRKTGYQFYITLRLAD
jgi:hypothetical protein